MSLLRISTNYAKDCNIDSLDNSPIAFDDSLIYLGTVIKLDVPGILTAPQEVDSVSEHLTVFTVSLVDWLNRY